MKKLFALGLLACSFTFSKAQEKNFQLGFHISPNFSWIAADSEGLESDGMRFGYAYGLVSDFHIAENYSLSTGFTLLRAGGKINYPDIKEGVLAQTPQNPNGEVGGRTAANVRLNYIQVPLTIKLKTNEIGYMKYFGQFGVAASFNIDAVADEEFDFPNSNNTGTITNEDVDYLDEINLFRASLLVGLGAEYNISGNTSIMFGINFDNGFLNILSDDIYDEDPNGNGTGNRDEAFKAMNNSLILNFGVLF
jgi:hypothetical protein